MTILYLMAIKLAKIRGVISKKSFINYLHEISDIENKIKIALKNDNLVKKVSKKYMNSKNCLYLGRGYNFPIALEGALKLKEISYIHAEGYPAAEMKHGPIALIDEDMPTVVIATNKINYDKIVSNLQVLKSRKGKSMQLFQRGIRVKKLQMM